MKPYLTVVACVFAAFMLALVVSSGHNTAIAANEEPQIDGILVRIEAKIDSLTEKVNAADEKLAQIDSRLKKIEKALNIMPPEKPGKPEPLPQKPINPEPLPD